MGKAFWIIHSILLLDLLAASSVKADGEALSADMEIIRQLISEKKALIIICSDLSKDLVPSLDEAVFSLGKRTVVQKVSSFNGTGKEAWIVSVLSEDQDQDQDQIPLFTGGLAKAQSISVAYDLSGKVISNDFTSCSSCFSLPEIYYARAGIEG